MCQMILVPRGVPIANIPNQYFKRSCYWNQHGMGYVFNENGRLNLFKSTNIKLEDFLERLNRINNDSTVIIHFRNSSHGALHSDRLTHPFFINENCAFAHNGVINGFGSLKLDENADSDTYDFNENFLKPLFSNWREQGEILRNPHFTNLVERIVFPGKMAFINNNGEQLIIGERLGKWENGVWYSNEKSLYKIPKKSLLFFKAFHFVK